MEQNITNSEIESKWLLTKEQSTDLLEVEFKTLEEQALFDIEPLVSAPNVNADKAYSNKNIAKNNGQCSK